MYAFHGVKFYGATISPVNTAESSVRALTIDHVLPRHLGGAHTWTNVVAACSSCNHRKGGMSLSDSGMTLINPPKEPPHSANYIFGHYLADNQEWENFLKGW